MFEYEIPASITLAQGILESGSGQSDLAEKSNNHFGIKCHSDWKGKKSYYDDDEENECFRKYESAEDSYLDHSLFLKNKPRYSNLFSLNITDYKGWAKGLKKAGYATDPKYPEKLIALIEEYKLWKYDGSKKSLKKEYRKSLKEEKNSSKIHLVKKGDTLYSISKKHNISIEKLKEKNNLNSNTLSLGQKLKI